MKSQGPRDLVETRWERVARSYLRPPPAGVFRVAVAGLGESAHRLQLLRTLRACVDRLGLAPREERAAPSVEIVDLGRVDEDRLALLALEPDERIDFLVWLGPARRAARARALYLLGVFAWAKSPGEVAALFPGRLPSAAQLQILADAGLTVPLSLHRLEETPSPRSELRLKGILQAALSRADAQRRLAVSRENASGRAEGG